MIFGQVILFRRLTTAKRKLHLHQYRRIRHRVIKPRWSTSTAWNKDAGKSLRNPRLFLAYKIFMTNSFYNHTMQANIPSYVPQIQGFHSRADFSTLTNVFGPSPLVRKALPSLLKDPMNLYPMRNPVRLKEKIASWLTIDPSMITVGNGSDELIAIIPQVHLEPGDHCVVQTPTFFRIIESLHRMKGEVLTVPATDETNFVLGQRYIESVFAASKRTNARITWLCSPNNPTGETIELDHITWLSRRVPGLLVVDEAYQEFFDPKNNLSATRLVDKHDNIIVTKTFSKAFGLAGIRVGFAISSPHLIDALERWRLNFAISSLSLRIAEAALDDISFLQKVHERMDTERTFLFTNIDKLPQLKRGGHSKTNVFILKHTNGNLFDLLLKRGIVTADFNEMNGLEHLGFVRITVKTRSENEILLQALRKTANGH